MCFNVPALSWPVLPGRPFLTVVPGKYSKALVRAWGPLGGLRRADGDLSSATATRVWWTQTLISGTSRPLSGYCANA